MRLATAILTAAAIALPALSTAEQITSQKPDSILSFFQTEGFPVKMGVASDGDPMINVRYYGTDFQIFFYDCQQNKDCMSIQFYSGYRSDGNYTIEQANVWNTQERYSRSFVSENGTAHLEYDIFLGQDGVSAGLFSDALGLWLKALKDFERYIGW